MAYGQTQGPKRLLMRQSKTGHLCHNDNPDFCGDYAERPLVWASKTLENYTMKRTMHEGQYLGVPRKQSIFKL